MVLLLSLYGFCCPLQKVKVKFLNCLMVTCFFIAAKIEEDIEVSESRDDHMIHIHLQNVPSLHQLVQESGCGCSTVDIQRMELIVMQKLEFNLVRAAPLEFLQIVSDVICLKVIDTCPLLVSHVGNDQPYVTTTSGSNSISAFESSHL